MEGDSTAHQNEKPPLCFLILQVVGHSLCLRE